METEAIKEVAEDVVETAAEAVADNVVEIHHLVPATGYSGKDLKTAAGVGFGLGIGVTMLVAKVIIPAAKKVKSLFKKEEPEDVDFYVVEDDAEETASTAEETEQK